MAKRILCFLLTLVMVVGLLASCGDDPVTPTPGPDDECVTCVDADENGRCDVCRKKMTTKPINPDKPPEDVIEYPWDTTKLLFRMTKNEGGSALPSGCERYLAGEDFYSRENIDSMVSERNTNAYDLTNVTVQYKYYDNVETYGWGKCIEVIYGEVFNDSQKTTTDMYCNYTYDMVGASLKGCFANLKSTAYAGENYFEFNKPDYDESVDNKGYMFDYMNSTTLSESRTYILASDYFIDLIRAFYIVPVHVGLLESGSIGMTVTGDLDGDGIFTIDDFYEEVKQKKWTYNKVAAYSELIYSGAGATKTLNDRLGFAVCQMGIAPNGLLFTTNLKIIEKPSAENDNKYTFPTTHSDLFDFAAALKDLATKQGVLVVSTSGEIAGHGSSPLLAIRNQFCAGNILFGDVMMLGALEYEEYQKLKKDAGFGVVPVPLWHDVAEGSDETYLTSIHNNGRPGAIARNTKNFQQCTAFLNYQSTHSTDILNYYYDFKLQYDVADGSPGTVYMLQYIRKNVRSAFDKTIEDAIGVFTNTEGDRWSQIIETSNDFNVDMRTEYDRVVGDKQKRLDNLVASFDALPE